MSFMRETRRQLALRGKLRNKCHGLIEITFENICHYFHGLIEITFGNICHC
jgi:hypothetical protein